MDKDEAFELFFKIVLAPVWVPVSIWDNFKLKKEVSKILKNDLDDSWLKCAEVWTKAGVVYGEEVGASMELPFEHALAASWKKFHPESKDFLLKKLSVNEAVLAAYAFKCLTRFSLDKSEIPSEVLDRDEELSCFLFGCTNSKLKLGEFISGYFNLPSHVDSGP